MYRDLDKGEGLAPSDGLPTHEPPAEIERFNQEARDALAKMGYEIYELTGKSYTEIAKELPPNLVITTNFFPSTEGGGQEDQLIGLLHSMRSQRTEVAIPRSDKVFLPRSDSDPAQRESQFNKFSLNLVRKVPNAKAAKGDTLDFVELGIQYFQRHNGVSLYGRWADKKHAITPSGLDVSSLPKDRVSPGEIIITYKPGRLNNEGPWVAPLVFPAKSPSPTPTPIQK